MAIGLVVCLAQTCLAIPPPKVQYVRGANNQVIARIYHSGGTSYYRGAYNQGLGKYNSHTGQYYNNRGIPSGKVR